MRPAGRAPDDATVCSDGVIGKEVSSKDNPVTVRITLPAYLQPAPQLPVPRAQGEPAQAVLPSLLGLLLAHVQHSLGGDLAHKLV